IDPDRDLDAAIDAANTIRCEVVLREIERRSCNVSGRNAIETIARDGQLHVFRIAVDPRGRFCTVPERLRTAGHRRHRRPCCTSERYRKTIDIPAISNQMSIQRCEDFVVHRSRSKLTAELEPQSDRKLLQRGNGGARRADKRALNCHAAHRAKGLRLSYNRSEPPDGRIFLCGIFTPRGVTGLLRWRKKSDGTKRRRR